MYSDNNGGAVKYPGPGRLNPCFIGMYRDILILKQLLLYNIVSKNINPYQTHLFHHLSRIFAKVRFFFDTKTYFSDVLFTETLMTLAFGSR